MNLVTNPKNILKINSTETLILPCPPWCLPQAGILVTVRPSGEWFLFHNSKKGTNTITKDTPCCCKRRRLTAKYGIQPAMSAMQCMHSFFPFSLQELPETDAIGSSTSSSCSCSSSHSPGSEQVAAGAPPYRANSLSSFLCGSS